MQGKGDHMAVVLSMWRRKCYQPALTLLASACCDAPPLAPVAPATAAPAAGGSSGDVGTGCRLGGREEALSRAGNLLERAAIVELFAGDAAVARLERALQVESRAVARRCAPGAEGGEDVGEGEGTGQTNKGEADMAGGGAEKGGAECGGGEDVDEERGRDGEGGEGGQGGGVAVPAAAGMRLQLDGVDVSGVKKLVGLKVSEETKIAALGKLMAKEPRLLHLLGPLDHQAQIVWDFEQGREAFSG